MLPVPLYIPYWEKAKIGIYRGLRKSTLSYLFQYKSY